MYVKALTVAQVSRLLGQRVRTERHRIGLTQERLAERVGLSPNFIAHLERGSRGASLDTIVTLARAFRVPVRTLFSA